MATQNIIDGRIIKEFDTRQKLTIFPDDINSNSFINKGSNKLNSTLYHGSAINLITKSIISHLTIVNGNPPTYSPASIKLFCSSNIASPGLFVQTLNGDQAVHTVRLDFDLLSFVPIN